MQEIIKLKDISARPLIEEIKGYCKIFDINSDIIPELEEIDNYQELKQLIIANPTISLPINLFSRLNETEDILNKQNALNEQNKQNHIILTSKTVPVGELLYKDITGRALVINRLSPYYSIYDFKKRVENNPNYFRGIGEGVIKELQRPLSFYDEHVLRLIDIYGLKEDLFYTNKNEKDKLVEQQAEMIVNYFVENANECVWGELTEAKKENLSKLFKGCVGNKKLKDQKYFVNAISNYVTLEEAEKDLVKTKTLNRFIVK